MVELLLIPVMSILTGFFILKGVQLGLRWNIQAQKGELPTTENPVTQIIETKYNEKIDQQLNSILDEYLNGKAG